MASTKKSALATNAIVDLTAMNTEVFINYKSFEQQAASNKQQATSNKRQASSAKRFEQRAASVKPRAASFKQQAASGEL